MQEKNVNFNDMSVEFKRGVGVWKIGDKWNIDTNIPIFTSDNGRAFIESLMPTK